MMHTYEYPRPAVVTDVVAFTIHGSALQVLLIQRANEPYKGAWALPGGFVGVDEDLDEAALRELHEETGLEGVGMEQLYAFGAPDRVPGQRVIAIAYCAIVPSHRAEVRAASDAAAARWWDVTRVPRLAFDHAEMLALAHERLRLGVARSVAAAHFLRPEFSLSELAGAQQAVLGRAVDPSLARRYLGRADGFEPVPSSISATQRDDRPYRLASPSRLGLLCVAGGELQDLGTPPIESQI